MSYSLRLEQLYRAGEVQYPLSLPPPMWPTLQLTEEALSLSFCRPGPCPGRNAADQWPLAQILQTELDVQKKIIKSNRLWVKDFIHEEYFLGFIFVLTIYFSLQSGTLIPVLHETS